MNAIGFLSFLLSILSFAVVASFAKFTSTQRVRSTYIGHLEANRSLLNQAVRSSFDKISGTRNENQESANKQSVKEKSANKETNRSYTPPSFNPDYSRFNLYPLLNGKKDPFLYAIALKMLHFLYGRSLFVQDSANRFFDAWLVAIDQRGDTEDPFALEKVAFGSPTLQQLYYRMLKGAPHKDPYPSLLEYFKIEPAETKIFLYQAHPTLLAALFSPEAAKKLEDAFHRGPKGPMPDREVIAQICFLAGLSIDPKLLDLCDLGKRAPRTNAKKIFLGSNASHTVALQKKLSIARSE
ncbi:MAG: hypothetical protein KGI80_00595 [Verrucomicrobiota bacterium]|nr:hypothetical protein [Verrucomicrobiota bacterium]